MRISKFCLMSLLSLLLLSCFSDKSTDAIRPLSEITIVSGIESVYNIEKNETIKIDPVVTQVFNENELQYTWEINLVEETTDTVFVFTGDKLGKYNCRLIVENKDGKTFFPFTIFVNSPYEEGITILSQDENGKSMISFMQKPNDGNKGKFMDYDCFEKNNPGESFAAGAIDIVQSSGTLMVLCQGGGEADDVPAIYYLNEKTFVVETELRVPEYEDFKPTMFAIPEFGYSGTSYPILCENGKVYDFSTTETVVSKPQRLQYTYEQKCIVTTDKGFDPILLWDKDHGGLSMIYYGLGPYFCSTEYLLEWTDAEFATKNYFANRQFVTMTKIHMTTEQKIANANHEEFLILTRSKLTPAVFSEVLNTDLWKYNGVENELITSCSQNEIIALPINVATPCIANKTFFTLLFASGNKVRSWKYDSPLKELPNAKTLATVGSDDAVITGFEMSDDNKKTYVAFYEPKQEGLNGSMWVIDTDKGTVLEQYDNISYQPVKMIYKKK